MMNDKILVFFALLLGLQAGLVVFAGSLQAMLFRFIIFTISLSFFWMSLGAHYLGWSLLLAYVGTVLVLFLFTLMWAERNLEDAPRPLWARCWSGLPVGVLVAVNGWQIASFQSPPLLSGGHVLGVPELGLRLFEQHGPSVLLLGLCLLVALMLSVLLLEPLGLVRPKRRTATVQLLNLDPSTPPWPEEPRDD